MVSFFPLDVLDENWDVIESVSEEFLTSSFRYGVLLFMVILIVYKYKISKNRCYMLDWPVTACMGNCCSPGCRSLCL